VFCNGGGLRGIGGGNFGLDEVEVMDLMADDSKGWKLVARVPKQSCNGRIRLVISVESCLG
jgi:hypothetical protein